VEIHQHVARAEQNPGDDPGVADAAEGGEDRHQNIVAREVEGFEHLTNGRIVEMRQHVGFGQPGGA